MVILVDDENLLTLFFYWRSAENEEDAYYMSGKLKEEYQKPKLTINTTQTDGRKYY